MKETTKELFLKAAKLFVKEGRYLMDEPESVNIPLGVQTHVREVVFLQKQRDPYLVYPDEGKRWRYELTNHWRGRSCHGDDRYEHEVYLIGWTLMYLRPGVVKKPVMTLAEAKRWWKDQRAWKINVKTGVPLERRIRGGVIRRANILAAMKAPHPKDWLGFQGVVPKGTVGATREFPGVFHILDQGRVEFGSLKPWFKEYYKSEGKLTQGRVTFRLLARKEVSKELVLAIEKAAEGLEVEFRKEFDGWVFSLEDEELYFLPQSAWEIFKEIRKEVLPPGIPEEKPLSPFIWLLLVPKVQRPYVLGQEAIEKEWLPPRGISALPEAWRKVVPKELRYWEMPRKKALEARAKLKEDRMLWSLTFLRNPFRVKKASGFEESIPAGKKVEIGDWVGLKFKKTGEIPFFEVKEKVGIAPKTWLNPGPRTPGWIRMLDSGEAVELIKEQDFRKYEFRGKELKGTYFFRRESPGMAIWEMTLSAGPGTERLPLKKLSLFKDDRFADKIPILKFDEFKGER